MGGRAVRVRYAIAAVLATLGVAQAGFIHSWFAASRAATTTPDTNVVTNGLMGWWQCDGSGVDSAGSNNLLLSSVVATNGTKGQANTAYYFNGSAYMYTNYPSLPVTTNSITVLLWVYPSGFGDKTYHCFIGWGGFISGGWILQRQGDYAGHTNSLRFAWNGTDYYDSPDNILTQENAWIQVGVVVSNGTPTSFIRNGVLYNSVRTTGSGTFSYTSQTTLNIGRRNDGLQYVIGSLDNVRLYNRMLNSSEINTVYQFEKP